MSHDGTLAAATGAIGGTLVFVGRDGSTVAASNEIRSYRGPRLSPDGRWISFTDDGDLWLLSLDRSSLSTSGCGRVCG